MPALTTDRPRGFAVATAGWPTGRSTAGPGWAPAA